MTAPPTERSSRIARDGWRLVQVLIEVPAAMPDEVVLILERPVGG